MGGRGHKLRANESIFFVDDPEQNIVHLGAVACAVHTLAHWV